MRDAAPLPVVRTEGSHIHLADGRVLIDGIASWWTACHGYNHPHIRDAVTAQLANMPHVMFGGLVHEPALTLATRLANLTGLPRVFFSDSGSVAVEIALKIALQYWAAHGQPAKTRFLSFRNAYHGDTFGAMSVSDPDQSIHAAYQPAVTPQHHLELPTTPETLAKLDHHLVTHHSTLAAVIIEPLLQGAGGMKFHSAETLSQVHALAKRYNLLFIADEIATGFGRTGNLFAAQSADITPDILCLGKALTGGTLTLAATLAQGHVFQPFLNTPFMHGPTYMANPLACAAANASLDLFSSQPRLQQVQAIERQITVELEPCRSLPNVVDVRVQGAVGVVQLTQLNRAALRQRFIDLGCWIRPLENVIYLTPAFTISPDELSRLTQAVHTVVRSPL
jgi:adenosylmethionine-8-amino-7-oxononanoate aminotransferase